MKRKNKCFRWAILLLLIPLFLSACGDSFSENTGNAQSEPLDRLLFGIINCDSATYESAFPSDFCRQYRAQYPDLDATVSLLLTEAQQQIRLAYGDGVTLRYELNNVREREPAELDIQGSLLFTGLDRVSYTLPETSITAAAELRVTVYFIGEYEHGSRDALLSVLCINGAWYLHPQSFGEVFLAD